MPMGTISDSDRKVAMTRENEQHNRTMGLSDPDVFGDEEQTWGMEKSADWRLAWQRAVAKAWAIPEFKTRLLEQPAIALKEVGWEVPKGLELKIELAGEGIAWDSRVHDGALISESAAGGHIAANGWAAEATAQGSRLRDRRTDLLKALRTTVVLRLPPQPKEEKFSALALADYDGLSRAYPFTCSCVC
jgi:hypothetical protein